MTQKRMRNIRADGAPHVYPSAIELHALIDLYADRLTPILESIGEPSPAEAKLLEVEARIEELERYNQLDRAALLQRIEELQQELELERKKK